MDPAPYRYEVIHYRQKRQGFLSGIRALRGKQHPVAGDSTEFCGLEVAQHHYLFAFKLLGFVELPDA